MWILWGFPFCFEPGVPAKCTGQICNWTEPKDPVLVPKESEPLSREPYKKTVLTGHVNPPFQEDESGTAVQVTAQCGFSPEPSEDVLYHSSWHMTGQNLSRPDQESHPLANFQTVGFLRRCGLSIGLDKFWCQALWNGHQSKSEVMWNKHAKNPAKNARSL